MALDQSVGSSPSLVELNDDERNRRQMWRLARERERDKLKNHLRWARIRVQGPREKISTTVEVVDGEFIYSLPIWCELLGIYRKRHVKKTTAEDMVVPDCRPI